MGKANGVRSRGNTVQRITIKTSSSPSTTKPHKRKRRELGATSKFLTAPEKFTQSGVVTVLVGPARNPFQLYRDLLCDRSPYFTAALKPIWNEASSELHLPNADTRAFAAFTNWVFAGSIPELDLTDPNGLANLTAVYKLGDFLMIEELKNDIINAVLAYLEEHNWAFNFCTLNFLRKQLLQATMLYKLVTKSSVRYFAMRPSDFEKGKDNDTKYLSDNPELLLDIIDGVRDWHTEPWPQVWDDDICAFHEHADGVKCEAK